MFNNFFVRLNKKQIIMFFGVTIIIAFVGTPFLGLYYFSFLFFFILFFTFGWYYSVGYFCNRIFSIGKSRYKFFIFFIYFIFIYLLILSIFAIIIFVPQIHESARTLNHKHIEGPAFPDFMITVLIILQLILMVAIFYSHIYISRSIASILIRKDSKFEDYSHIYFYLMIIPVGFWFIQPKVNQIYERYLAEKEQHNE
ncbi:MAG: hypothetical protein V1779_09300 [bacterium]